MNNSYYIDISKDFSLYPGARNRTDGDYSGEVFYKKILKPKFEEVLNKDDTDLEISFDGTFGYASSFISEVFSRLVKDFHNKELILKKLKFKSEDNPMLIDAILRAINETD